MLNGIDTSAYNPITDYAAVKGSGLVQFWFNKATEGTGYQNSNYRAVHDGAKGVGIPFGAYHFFHGNVDGNAQAQYFLNFISGYEGQLLPFVDCETDDGVDSATWLGNLTAFLGAVDATLSGKRTIIYFGYSFWQTFLGGTDDYSGHPAFPAAYNNDTSLDMTGTGWTKWTLWQYSDGSGKSSIPGITGNVDRDRLNSDDISLIQRA
jgi:lysozyme